MLPPVFFIAFFATPLAMLADIFAIKIAGFASMPLLRYAMPSPDCLMLRFVTPFRLPGFHRLPPPCRHFADFRHLIGALPLDTRAPPRLIIVLPCLLRRHAMLYFFL